MNTTITIKIRRAACLLAAVWMVCATAWAGEPVTYIDENGDEQTVTEYTVLTGNEPVTVDEYGGNYVSLAGGTYVMNSDVTYPCKVEMTGNVTLILADGANMTIIPTQDDYGISSYIGEENLTIYGQKNQTGTLTVSGKGGNQAIALGSLTVNGGDIKAYGEVDIYETFTLNGGSITVNKDATTNIASVYASGDVTINGGSLTINGGDAADSNNGLKGNSVFINGGTVTVTGDAYGIYADNDVTITGGTINATATATTGNLSRGIDCHSEFTMSGGTVTATGQQYGIYSYFSFTFGGGQLTANIADGSTWADSYGIFIYNSSTHSTHYRIYYSHASDFIKASSYNPRNVFFYKTSVSDGYILVNDATPATELSGRHWSSDADFNDILAAINGQKLTPKLCTVTLPDGVTAVGDGLITVGDELKAAVVLPVTLGFETEPTREGYTFAGLAATDADDNSVDVNEGVFTMPNSDVTVSMLWTIIDYTIDYELNGGTVATPNPTTYNIESAEITLVNPTREGLEFNGWTGTGLDGPTMTVKIATGSTEYRKYTATWKAAMADGSAYDGTSDLDVDVATYTKTLGSARTGKFQAWLVPFDHAITQDDADKFTFYKINMIANAPNPETEASDEMWVFLKRMSLGDVLHANMPYVFKPKENMESYAFTTPNATLKARNDDVIAKSETLEDVYSFYATYENTTATAADPFYYVGIDGSLSLGNNGEVTVGPLRWIIRKESKFGQTTSYAREMHFYDGEETTGIGDATRLIDNGEMIMDNGAGAVYDLSGRKVSVSSDSSVPSVLPKGVYIVNGKLVVVK